MESVDCVYLDPGERSKAVEEEDVVIPISSALRV